MFQPTRPHGARPDIGSSICITHGVSTHAPARGATAILFILKALLMFQPTRPHGARLAAANDWGW